ncbi:PspC domain-containing protein [Bergeyella sp. RCAD1439]|uniref:PspC domain-containing protein n=1 Tax=Bergeyella anatis TaxID=3113737 RepID=UPI002E17DFAC|nr:PspC domain-containing protein [Bergeyella sp. RCAD1439]
MNRTLSIGLAGYSFVIEEHAYIKLSDYLDALKKALDAEEAEEVLHDIEIRMVEIFKESLGKREVINDADVEKMINQIGKPEQIEEQEEVYFSEKKQEKKHSFGQKQLFRDPSRAKIAGVCAGLSHYFGINVTLIRAVLVGLIILDVTTAWSFSISVLFLSYLILWIILPKAQTASDFLKMEGKPANFDNLKEQSNKIIQFANESSQKVGEFYHENQPYLQRTGSSIANAFRYFFGGLFGLIALSLFFGSFSIFAFSDSGNVKFGENLGFFLQSDHLGYLVFAVSFLTLFIPSLIFAYIALRFLAPKTRLQNTRYVIGGLCFLWFILTSITGFKALKYNTQFSGKNEETENIVLPAESDSLYVDLKKVVIPKTFKAYWNDVYSDGKIVYKENHPRLNIQRQDVKQPYLAVEKSAKGYNLPLNLKIPLEIQGNKILLPNYIAYSFDNRLRKYEVKYQLVIPKNTKIINLNPKNILYFEENPSDPFDSSDNVSFNIETESDSIIIRHKKYATDDLNGILDSLVNDKLEKLNSDHKQK